MADRPRVGWPMFPRVLAVMIAGVLAVQFANFALLQLLPLPQPPLFTVAQVAAALRGHGDGSGLRSALDAEPRGERQDRAVRLAEALARDLGVEVGAVRLSFVGPPRFGGPPPGAPRPPPVTGRESVLIGDFTAGLRRSDGRWLTVRPLRSGMAAWRARLLFWLLIALATVTPFAWLLARWVTRPIATFASAAERIGRDPYTAPLVVHGPAEITHAAAAMNEMQTRLTRFVDDRTLMIGAIAHDLRTPLMRMALRLGEAPDATRRGIERDIADMQAMIDAAARYVRGTTDVGPRQRLDLGSLVETAVCDLADHGAPASFLPSEQAVLEGNPVALRTVIDNLLTNALRYGGDAEALVRQEGAWAVIEIRDHGPGLDEADLERVFEPFFRGERSRNRETGGLGLGLSSVRAVVRLHGGEVGMRNHPDGGLVARVALPL